MVAQPRDRTTCRAGRCWCCHCDKRPAARRHTWSHFAPLGPVRQHTRASDPWGSTHTHEHIHTHTNAQTHKQTHKHTHTHTHTHNVGTPYWAPTYRNRTSTHPGVYHHLPQETTVTQHSSLDLNLALLPRGSHRLPVRRGEVAVEKWRVSDVRYPAGRPRVIDVVPAQDDTTGGVNSHKIGRIPVC